MVYQPTGVDFKRLVSPLLIARDVVHPLHSLDKDLLSSYVHYEIDTGLLHLTKVALYRLPAETGRELLVIYPSDVGWNTFRDAHV